MGTWPPVRFVSGCRVAQRRVHPPTVGDRTVPARVLGAHGARADDRSWAWEDRGELDQPWRKGSGIGSDMDGGDGSRRAAVGRAAGHERHPVPGGSNHRTVARGRLQRGTTEGGGAVETRQVKLPAAPDLTRSTYTAPGG